MSRTRRQTACIWANFACQLGWVAVNGFILWHVFISISVVGLVASAGLACWYLLDATDQAS